MKKSLISILSVVVIASSLQLVCKNYNKVLASDILEKTPNEAIASQTN